MRTLKVQPLHFYGCITALGTDRQHLTEVGRVRMDEGNKGIHRQMIRAECSVDFKLSQRPGPPDILIASKVPTYRDETDQLSKWRTLEDLVVLWVNRLSHQLFRVR